MRSIFYFALGLIAGILTIRFGISAIRMFITFQIITGIVDAFVAWGLGLLTIKMFEEI